jgi:uncharacterized protein (TIGR01777 family)
MRASYGPINTLWTVEHKNFVENRQFCDFQVQGPFQSFEQLHLIEPIDSGSSLLRDTVHYQLPLSTAGEVVGAGVARSELERLFRYRHDTLKHDLNFAKQCRGVKMKVAVTGSTGLIGSALVPLLTTQGAAVRRLIRKGSQVATPETGESAIWDPAKFELDVSALEGCDAVVHLAGDSIGSERWSEQKKRRLWESRIGTTQLLCQKMMQLKTPVKVFVCASAIGYYGDRGDELMTEEGKPGSGFLADLCQEWEKAADEAKRAGTRVINSRFGVVLSPKGGALQKMLLPFEMGGGGVIGNGRQYFSWIAIDDVAAALLYCLGAESVSGPVNVVAPNPVTNQEYTRALGRVLHRPTVLPMPAFAARMAFGQFADECLLASTRVVPNKLLQAGYQFRYPQVDGALTHVLGRETARVSA